MESSIMCHQLQISFWGIRINAEGIAAIVAASLPVVAFMVLHGYEIAQEKLRVLNGLIGI
jgi:hypothetical protein